MQKIEKVVVDISSSEAQIWSQNCHIRAPPEPAPCAKFGFHPKVARATFGCPWIHPKVARATFGWPLGHPNVACATFGWILGHPNVARATFG